MESLYAGQAILIEFTTIFNVAKKLQIGILMLIV
jgi:hypothetical protein